MPDAIAEARKWMMTGLLLAIAVPCLFISGLIQRVHIGEARCRTYTVTFVYDETRYTPTNTLFGFAWQLPSWHKQCSIQEPTSSGRK